MADHADLGSPRAAKWQVLEPSERHPLQAGLGALALISGWFFAVAAFELWVALCHDLALVSVFFTGLTAVAALGLCRKASWSFVLGLLMAARQVFGVVYLMRNMLRQAGDDLDGKPRWCPDQATWRHSARKSWLSLVPRWSPCPTHPGLCTIPPVSRANVLSGSWS